MKASNAVAAAAGSSHRTIRPVADFESRVFFIMMPPQETELKNDTTRKVALSTITILTWCQGSDFFQPSFIIRA
jgi:hypothetical protein